LKNGFVDELSSIFNLFAGFSIFCEFRILQVSRALKVEIDEFLMVLIVTSSIAVLFEGEFKSLRSY
jgi:hypothetical protein